MADKFRNQYRISSSRLPGWDYSRNATYFITICTKHGKPFFGKVQDKNVYLSGSGKIAVEIWLKIPDQFSYAALDEFVVMPDHFHGIVVIRKDVGGNAGIRDAGMRDAGMRDAGGDAMNRVCTDANQQMDQDFQNGNLDEQKERGGIVGDKNPMLHENLSRVIRWFKGRASFEIRKIEPEFGWHERFHEKIIRDDAALQRVRQYIRENPGKSNR